MQYIEQLKRVPLLSTERDELRWPREVNALQLNKHIQTDKTLTNKEKNPSI